MKKKILFATGISTVAAVAGVAPAIASVTNTQSSTVDVNDPTKDPSTPVDPSSPIVATLPSSDSFTYKVDYDGQTTNEGLNEYLSSLFSATDFFNSYKTSFTNYSQYTNVKVVYENNSANFENKTFKLSVTPIEKAVWSDKTSAKKTILVNMPNFKIAEPVVPVTPTIATSPASDMFTYQVNYSGPTSNEGLNKYLSNLFASANFFDNFRSSFLNNTEYTNVKVVYENNSANFNNKSFKLGVTPLGKAVWEDKTSTNKRTVSVNIQNFESTVSNSQVPEDRQAHYFTPIKGAPIGDNNEFNDYLVELFKTNQLGNLRVNGRKMILQNVNIEYINGSANFENRTFQIKATPLRGHSWVSGISENNVEPQIITVTVDELSTKDQIVNLPKSWAINWVLNSKFKFTWTHPGNYVWKNCSWFLHQDFDYYWLQNNPKFYLNQSVKYQQLMFDGGVKDLKKNFPTLDVVSTFETVKWEYIQRINDGVLFNFIVNVKPKDGFFWEDGSTGTKELKIRLFALSEPDVTRAGLIGDTYDPENIEKFIAADAVSDLPSKYWVTNALLVVKNNLTKPTFAENQAAMMQMALEDLQICFPTYNIEVSDMFSSRPGQPYNYHSTWKYNIKFTSKFDPSFVKEMPGYFFTID